MGLRFIYGRAGSGKTRHCLDEIKSEILSGKEKQLVLLVPEQYTFQAERELIDLIGCGGILQTEVLSFRRLAFRVFNEVGGITYPHLHPSGKNMIIYRILDRLKGSLKVFSNSLDRQGFVRNISTLITEFKRYNLDALALEGAYKNIDDESTLKDKIKEIGLVYSEFEKELQDKFRDTDDDLTLAAEKLEDSGIYEGAKIWIDGFSGFTPQEYSIISKLMTKVDMLNISLCCDNLSDSYLSDVDVFASTKKSYKKLMVLANNNNIVIEKSILKSDETLNRFSNSLELSHLERYLNAYPFKTFNEKTKDIVLFSAVNIFSEVEETARDIVSLCRDKDIRYRDIAVVTRNLPGYEKIIEVIFAEYGIPCFIDKKVDITNHPLVRLILSMLEIFNENWSYESVFRYLKTGLTGIVQSDIDILENYVLACGIRGSRWTNGKDWSMMPGLMPHDNDKDTETLFLENINRIKNIVSTPIIEFRDKTKGRTKASEFCESLYDFLNGIGVPGRIEEHVEKFKASGYLNLANEYSQVWNTIMSLFDQVVESMGDERVGVERFSNVLKMGLSEYQIGLIPASIDQVMIGSVERSKSHCIKALYVLGANDGVFPSSAIDEGILSDQDRFLLNNLGIELSSDTRTKAFEEQYLVYTTLTSPSQYLRVSWPIADHEGRSMRPSIVISRIRKLFPNVTETSNIVKIDSNDNVIKCVSEKQPTFKQMISALRKKSDGEDIETLWAGVYDWFSQNDEWKQKCDIIKKSLSYKNIAERISQEKIKELYGDPMISSVSRLERYTACPFSFYVQYGLKAKERVVFSLRPPDIGTFMHTVIERFSKVVSSGDVSWRSFDRAWCNQKVSEIVDEMILKMQGSGIAGSKRYLALITRLKRVITRAVWLISEHIRRSRFTPIGYEVGFGEKEEYPPITILLDTGEKVKLTGRIDRVDSFKTEDGVYLRIVDYKSGSKSFKLSDVYYGLQIQLITYLDAILGSGKLEFGDKIFPGGMLYFKVDDPIIKGIGKLAEEDIEKAIMKQLKMRGLLLSDVNIIKEMDNTIEGASLIIPATINKGDILGKNTSCASIEQFTNLRKYIRGLLKDICTEILKGNIPIKPYKNRANNSCTYCNFISVCQFDTTTKDNSFNVLFDKNNDEIWKQIGSLSDCDRDNDSGSDKDGRN